MTQRRLWSHGQPGAPEHMDAKVHWVCHKVEHQAAPSRGGRGGLTVYQGRWAYCDAEVNDTAHEWSPTGGVTFEQLVDWTKALDPLRAHTIRP